MNLQEPRAMQPGLGNIQVRPVMVEDAEYTGKLSVEAFEGKFNHHIGERKSRMLSLRAEFVCSTSGGHLAMDPQEPITTQPGLSDVQVRPMMVEDADFAGKLSVEAFEGKFEHCVGERNMNNAIRGCQDAMRLMGSEYWRILVATCNGEPAGMIQIDYHGSKIPSDSGNAYVNHLSCWPSCRLSCLECCLGHKVKKTEGYIAMICCDSKFRGRGIGKQLMQAAEAQARDRGCTHMSLMVASDNRARHLYERQGYNVIETTDSCCAGIGTGIRKFDLMEKKL